MDHDLLEDYLEIGRRLGEYSAPELTQFLSTLSPMREASVSLKSAAKWWLAALEADSARHFQEGTLHPPGLVDELKAAIQAARDARHR